MLEITVIMNSSVEAVLAFKCCNMSGQNTEIHLKNLGPEPLKVPSACDLVGETSARLRVDTIYPPGIYTLAPGEVLACYCSLADDVVEKYKWIEFCDTEGGRHRSLIKSADNT